MSVLVHDVAAAPRRSPHQRLAVAATVLATLVVVAGPALTAGPGPGRRVAVDPAPELTLAARRVLEKVPGAYETGGDVVVPVGTNPNILWTGALSPDLVVGPVVPLGVRGLAEPGYLPSNGKAPAWLERIGTEDQVYDDVGDLSFACTRWPGVADCTGALLMEHAGERYIFRSGLHLTPSPAVVTTFLVLDDGLPRNLVLGGAPPSAARVVVTLAGEGEVQARITRPRAVRGATVWWVTTADTLSAVTFLGRDGTVIARSSFGG